MNILKPGASLKPGEQLSSTNGCYDLSFQGDGNLVLYRHEAGVTTVMWSSGTPWWTDGDLNCAMQGDGNLVLYRDGAPYWASDTFMGQTRLVLQNDGRLVLEGPPQPQEHELSAADPNPPPPQHFDPSTLTKEEIAQHVIGGMWTARSPMPYGDSPVPGVPFGPRPNEDSNILAMDYLEWLPDEKRARGLAEYASRGYRMAVTGPVIDPGGYHGQYPAYPGPLTQAWWDHYLDCLQEWWDCPSGYVVPAFFALPDDWDVARAKAELEPFFRQERAQRLLRFVVAAWEPNWASAVWVEVMTWLTDVFPNAVWGIHLTPNHSAPGLSSELTDDFTEADMWAAVAAMCHVFLEQSSCWFDGSEYDRAYWTAMWNPRMQGGWESRFQRGYAGWPTKSAWPGGGIWAFPAEFLSYDCFWHDRPEADAKKIGDAAIAEGAPGSLDGCTVN